MRAVSVLFVLPIFMALNTQLIQAQTLSDDQPLANEDDCIKMTDAKLNKIKKIIQELTEFIDALAEKNEDFDLRLVKLDVDKHDESETDDKSTVLELFVNDCAKRFGSYYLPRDFTDNKENKGNDEIYATTQSVYKDVKANKTSTTTKNTFDTSLEMTEKVQSQNEHINSDINEESSKTNTNKKIVKKSKYQVTTKNRRDIAVNKDSATETNRSLNRRDQATTKIDLKRQNKSKQSIESSSNHEKTSIDDVYSEDNKRSFVISNDDIQSNKHIENISNHDNKLSTDDTTSSISQKNQSTNSENDNNSTDTVSIDDTHEANNTKTSLNSEFQSTSNYKNNYTNKTSTDNIYEENNEKSSVDTNQSTNNYLDNNTDKISTNSTSTESNTQWLINNKKQQTKIVKNSDDNEKISTDTEHTSDNNYNNQRSNKMDDDKNNAFERKIFSFSESRLLQSLRQIIRNEIETITKDNGSNIRTHNDFGLENDVNNDYNDKENKTKGFDDNERTSKPEFIILDLDNDLLQLIKRHKCKNNNPMLVYLQEQVGQQRMVIL